MGAEYERPPRERLDYVEYLGFCPVDGGFIERQPSGSSPEDLRVEPATEVVLEIYGHPEAQVRLYVRADTPTLIVLSLLEKIATAVELQQYLRNQCDYLSKAEQTDRTTRARENEHQGVDSCRRCRLSLQEKSSIRDAAGLLCISCARELELL